MVREKGHSDGSPAAGSPFPSTHWSVVLAAGDAAAQNADQALAQLCRKYWHPLYCFIRRRGYRPEDAQDLTQEFLAQILEHRYLGCADPRRGRFRSFLLASLNHFLSDQWDRAKAEKRGGGRPPISFDAQEAEERYQCELTDGVSPERVYEQRWAVALLDDVLDRLHREYTAAGRAGEFDTLKALLWGPDASATYAQIADKLGLTESGVKSAVRRLRGRYRRLLRDEIADTVAGSEELEDEIRWLFATFE
jgi:RNA polymerase sigma factor (sigma-70 family)